MPSKPTPAPAGRTAAPLTDWDRVAANPEFRALMKAKVRFIVPATVFFVVYYFALPLLVGYAPDFMSTPVLGVVNIAYLFALSQFFMAWGLAWAYVRAAGRFDTRAQQILADLARQTNSTKEQR